MTATRPRVVRERIDPRLTSSLFANYRSAGDALLELVDNAVDARIPGQPLDVAVALRPGSLTLTATGGRGMSPRQLERDYLRWGASPKRGGELIGRFGQGGKAAIGHLGNRFRIVASPAGDERAYTFRDDAYRDRTRLRTYELQDLAKPVAAGLGYVRIEVGEVDKRLDPARVRIRLAEVYRPLLLAGELVLKVDRSPVQPLPWPVVEQHAISVRAGGRTVRGWWGLLTEPQPPGLVPGFRVYHMGRLIGEPVWFGHVGPGMHPALGRLVGEVEIPHVPVTMNKSDVDRDSPEWAAVEHRLHRLLAPVVRRLTSQQGPGASPQQARTAQQVRRILARALRMVESSALFESRDAGGADGPKEQLTFDQLSPEGPDHPPAASVEPHAPEDASTSERDPPQDGAAPPPGPRGTRRAGTRRGFGDVTIRALDPRVRSALIEEEGVRTVVINSRYPLFDVRKGDLWYQLETALREVCVTIPEAHRAGVRAEGERAHARLAGTYPAEPAPTADPRDLRDARRLDKMLGVSVLSRWLQHSTCGPWVETSTPKASGGTRPLRARGGAAPSSPRRSQRRLNASGCAARSTPQEGLVGTASFMTPDETLAWVRGRPCTQEDPVSQRCTGGMFVRCERLW